MKLTAIEQIDMAARLLADARRTMVAGMIDGDP